MSSAFRVELLLYFCWEERDWRRLSGFTKNRSFSRFAYRLWKESHLSASYLFSRRRFEYISTSLSNRLAYVAFRFTWQTYQASLKIAFFLDRLLLAFPTVQRSSNFKIYFLAQNNKNKKYENASAPADFVTKEVAWFWLDNFDSQTFLSWVGFA